MAYKDSKSSSTTTTDPYYLTKGEIQRTISRLNDAHSRWKQLLADGNFEILDKATADLKESIHSFSDDLAYFGQTIDLTEAHSQKYGVSFEEIERRRTFYREVKDQIQAIEESINSSLSKQKMRQIQRNRLIPQEPQISTKKRFEEEMTAFNQKYLEEETLQQEQIFRDQDNKLDILHEHAQTLHQVGLEIGNAVDDTTREIEEISENVEKQNRKLGVLNKAMDKIINTKDKKKWCLILFLVIVLIILIVILFRMMF
ncbi:Syntaxin 6B [Monocercomonoides exilis]|uniref:Syntaxin 6B n=1 Tax=Monocercomonoides exilis TaxID=2049356 RepID=UPI0035599A51|nr:Syntaxin 6B [Monocercomonoides exilis]|eukprot:MONOS_11257.1-p1 / transcript=MONOS_11257.1 / gene=MONOS_11257 / organism=Monocercomonoides_exilis_PA203 / gene_product= Syntaxin 6B / transcript_product= Syntaxin 6B / location=Mono_scaffold00554:39801-40895(+) / protein_length=257 / sequence_SO=supercontig / SO=protein_coding / is_pseudo=false